MLFILIESFILSLMFFFKLNQLENHDFAQLDWLLVTVRVNIMSAVINLDLSGLHEGLCWKKKNAPGMEWKCTNLRYSKLEVRSTRC